MTLDKWEKKVCLCCAAVKSDRQLTLAYNNILSEIPSPTMDVKIQFVIMFGGFALCHYVDRNWVGSHKNTRHSNMTKAATRLLKHIYPRRRLELSVQMHSAFWRITNIFWKPVSLAMLTLSPAFMATLLFQWILALILKQVYETTGKSMFWIIGLYWGMKSCTEHILWRTCSSKITLPPPLCNKTIWSLWSWHRT